MIVGSMNEMMSHKEPKFAEKPSIRINGKYDTNMTEKFSV